MPEKDERGMVGVELLGEMQPKVPTPVGEAPRRRRNLICGPHRFTDPDSSMGKIRSPLFDG